MPVPVAAAYFHEELMTVAENEGIEGYPKVTIVASHEGQVGRATHFRTALQTISGYENNIELAVLSKSRIPPGATHYEPKLVGTVAGRKCILVDDIVNTGTTLVSNIQMLKQEGAESVYAWATHGVFGPEGTVAAPERLQEMCSQDMDSFFKYLLISNSVTNPHGTLPHQIRLLNIAPLLAEAIARSVQCQSVSSILDLDFLYKNTDHPPNSVNPERYDND